MPANIIFPLHGEDLRIRPFAHGDEAQFVAATIESLASVGLWMPWCHSGYTAEEAKSWIDHCSSQIALGTAYDLGIFSADGHVLFGGVAINRISYLHNYGNIGYWVRQSRQRQGIAVNAVRMMVDFGFRHLKLTRLEIVAAEQNRPSRGVAEKVGASLEGVLRNRLVIRGEPIAAAMYSLVP